MVSLLSKLTRDKDEIDWVRKNMKYVFVGTAPLSQKINDQFHENHKISSKNLKITFVNCFFRNASLVGSASL